MTNELIAWSQENNAILLKGVNTSLGVMEHALQLSDKDKTQIIKALEHGHFEMGLTYIWGKTLTALKKELATIGVSLIGEMLGKPGIDETDSIDDIVTAKETITLAEELGIVSKTESLRLRQAYELINHFSKLEIEESDANDIDELEAILILKTCVISVLGRPKVEVAKTFVEFRKALEEESFTENDIRVELLTNSPYFFFKLTINILMNAAKVSIGAKLENALANTNIIIPSIWHKLREAEKWQIGKTYSEVYAEGKTTAVSGLKNTLLKVKGFDFVPETLRSNTFINAALKIIKIHEGFNNFYNEIEPVRNFGKLGTTIPAPALPICVSALLCVVLGNCYGHAKDAQPEALDLLKKLSLDRWGYYISNVLSGDIRILNKLTEKKPIKEWISLISMLSFEKLLITKGLVSKLIDATIANEGNKVESIAKKLITEYYKGH